MELSTKYPVTILLEVSKVSHSTYYAWLKRKDVITNKMTEDEYIIDKIKDLYQKHKGRYGVDRMTHALEQDYDIKINRKRTYRLMKNNGYLAVIKTKKKYNKSGEVHPKHNVLKRNFTTSCPFDKIATDVTEIKNKGKKIYISPIKDLHTHVIEANEITNHATLEIGMKMLEQIKDKCIPEGTIFHSDQGGIYNSLVFQQFLEENNYIQSMSRKGTPIDNSPMESFFGTLKSELLYNPLINLKNCDMIEEIKNYIDYYNNKRIQKSLGYLTPMQYKEKELERLKKEKVLQ